MDSESLKISLDKIEQMEKVLEHVALQDVSFNADGAILDVKLV